MAEDTVSANVQSALIDAGLWLHHGFFVPGDYVFSILSTHAPRVGQFLGLRAVGHGSVLSGIISGVAWLGAIVLIVATCKVVHKLDRALTAYIVRLHEGLRRTGRIVARRLTIAYRSRALKRQARLARTEVAEQGELTALELAVLRSHVKLAPGHLLTASAIASALDVELNSRRAGANQAHDVEPRSPYVRRGRWRGRLSVDATRRALSCRLRSGSPDEGPGGTKDQGQATRSSRTALSTATGTRRRLPRQSALLRRSVRPRRAGFQHHGPARTSQIAAASLPDARTATSRRSSSGTNRPVLEPPEVLSRPSGLYVPVDESKVST